MARNAGLRRGRVGSADEGTEQGKEIVMGDFWKDTEVIDRYTRAQALEDGVLVDVSKLAREQGFNWPVAITAAVQGYIDPPPEFPCQDATGRLWDLLTMLRIAVKKGGRIVEFKVIFQLPKSRPYAANEKRFREGRNMRVVTLKAVSGPGDRGEPVLTVMLPGED